ncbi:MAG: hypothetical protein AAFX53_06690 [Bacteroidota bacterium]
MKKRITILYVLLLLSVAVTVFYMFRNHGLQHDLKQNLEVRSQAEHELRIHRELLGIDSLLAEGEYGTALLAYKEQRKTLAKGDSVGGIGLRIELSQSLLKLRATADLAQAQLLAEGDADSVDLERRATPMEIRQYDSLSFALEKTKVQLARTQRQLREKSFGEYLTFTSKKGSLMHYVGGVRDKKANGFGIALLDTGSRYEGEWKDNQRHGNGTFYWPDGEYYVGGYTDDKRNGEGTYYWPNGEKYTGQWKDDKRNGNGTFYGKDGKMMTQGIWKEDKLVQADKKQKRERR